MLPGGHVPSLIEQTKIDMRKIGMKPDSFMAQKQGCLGGMECPPAFQERTLCCSHKAKAHNITYGPSGGVEREMGLHKQHCMQIAVQYAFIRIVLATSRIMPAIL